MCTQWQFQARRFVWAKHLTWLQQQGNPAGQGEMKAPRAVQLRQHRTQQHMAMFSAGRCGQPRLALAGRLRTKAAMFCSKAVCKNLGHDAVAIPSRTAHRTERNDEGISGCWIEAEGCNTANSRWSPVKATQACLIFGLLHFHLQLNRFRKIPVLQA
jgi:hypothetical protein